MIKIIRNAEKISRCHLGEIKKLADSLKKQLGFIPYSAYEPGGYKGNVFVAVTKQQPEQFAGFVLCGGRGPTRKIFQLAVAEKYRKQRVGSKLVDHVVKDALRRKCSEICIKVGKTLPANKFWDKAGFRLINTIEGGKLHPKINVRFKELVPTVFTPRPPAVLPSLSQNVLRLAKHVIEPSALYCIDTNIVLDMAKSNREHHVVAVNLLQMEKQGEISLAIAPKTIAELEKNQQSDDSKLLNLLARLRRLLATEMQDQIDKVCKAIFAHKYHLGLHDEADATLLATAIANKATGFITRDNKILKNHEVLLAKFGIQVLAPEEFWRENESEELRLDDLDLKSLVSQKNHQILPQLPEQIEWKIVANLPEYKIDRTRFDYASTYGYSGNALACAIEKRYSESVRARKVHLILPTDYTAKDVKRMLDYVSRNVAPKENKVGSVHIQCYGMRKEMTGIFMGRGYGKENTTEYSKIFAGKMLAKQNWQQRRLEIQRLTINVVLPDSPPKYRKFDQPISLGKGDSVPLAVLENFLSTILLLPGRDGVILPIKKDYAENLFSLGVESLLPVPEAYLSGYKSYFGDYRAFARLQPGNLLFFYRTKFGPSQGQIVVVSRIVRSRLMSTEEALRDQTASGQRVLTDGEIRDRSSGGKILETVVTNSVILPKPIQFSEISKIVPGNNRFQTAFPINHQQVCQLLEKGGML